LANLLDHLSLDQQRQIKIQYPDITFPPHWPQAIQSGHRNQKISNQLEHDYSLAARNIYDVLDTLDQQDEVDQERDGKEDRPTGAPSQDPKPSPSNPAANSVATCRSPSPKKGKTRPNTSIIAMLNPSRHIFRDWTPLPFSVHEDVGLEVGKEIIRKIAEAIDHPMPAAPSSKDSREMMINKLWRTHGLDEVEKGECGPQMKKCLHDVITDLGHLSEADDVKEQITIRMTKTMHQDPPPH
jgi:hypothetical protein